MFIFIALVILVSAYGLLRFLTGTSKTTHCTPPHIVNTFTTAKGILAESPENQTQTRAKANLHLKQAFGLANTFTLGSNAFRTECNRAVKAAHIKWPHLADIAVEEISRGIMEQDATGPVEVCLVEWVQRVTLVVILKAYLGFSDVPDNVRIELPEVITKLWILSKHERSSSSTFWTRLMGRSAIYRQKSHLNKLLASLGSPLPTNASILFDLHKVSHEHFPSSFSFLARFYNLFHGGSIPELISSYFDYLSTPPAAHLTNHLNILLPAYENMWRLILYSVLSTCVHSPASQSLPFPDLLRASTEFLDSPSPSTLKSTPCQSLHHTILETLRLYPPTRHIHRSSSLFSKITIDIESVQRDQSVFTAPMEFNPDRWKTQIHDSFMPFSIGPLGCIAKSWAPVVAATIVAAFVRDVDGWEISNGEMPVVWENGRNAVQWVKVRVALRNCKK